MLPPFTLALYPEVPVIRTADARIDGAGPNRAERQAAVIDQKIEQLQQLRAKWQRRLEHYREHYGDLLRANDPVSAGKQ